MGHVRLGKIPRTRRWQEVLQFILGGASIGQVANAAIRVLEGLLKSISQDRGVIESVWWMFHLPRSARQPDLVQALQKYGMTLEKPPSVCELLAGLSDTLHQKMANQPTQSDFGEMAQMALNQTLSQLLSNGTQSLFDTTATDVQKALANLATEKHYGLLAKQFFGTFLYKSIDATLGRALPSMIGEGQRFSTTAQLSAYQDALKKHCLEAAEIVKRFAGEWESKTHFQQGKITRKEVGKFTYGAMCKLIAELKKGAGIDVV